MDFILGTRTSVTDATFTGLLPVGATVGEVVVEIYRVFPNDLNVGRTTGSGTTPPCSRPRKCRRGKNSPSGQRIRHPRPSNQRPDAFSTDVLNASFSVLNSVTPGGIHPLPNVFSGGNGGRMGEEVEFTVELCGALQSPR